MKYERREEREFDEWFLSLPQVDQKRWRHKGIIPYCDMPTTANVFPIITNHKAWEGQSTESTERVESTRFIDEDELRGRLVELFRILDRFADGRMSLHLLFIRTVLGEDTGVNLVQIAKRYKLTKQAVFWRARQIRSCLGTLASGKITWTRPRLPSKTPAFRKYVTLTRKKGAKPPPKESPCTPRPLARGRRPH
jgi:hypothetical protein